MADKCLVTSQPRGSLTPLFVAHGMQCDPTFAHVLARYLGRERPIFGFWGVGMDGKAAPLDRIEAIAKRFIESVKRVQPRGPYLLSGFCAGGHIAMEMAHQFVAAGQAVEHLLLIDTLPSADPENFNQAMAEAIAVAEKRLQNIPRFRETLAGSPRVVAAFADALRVYRPKPYSGKVHILANQNRIDRMMHPDLGWQKFVPPGTVVYQIGATHEALTVQAMTRLSRFIRQQLAPQ